MSKKVSKVSYANSVRRTLPLKIKEIPIKKWLKHYGLDEFYQSLFIEEHIFRDGPYVHDELLQSIKTNVDLLFSFEGVGHFLNTIETLIGVYLYQKTNGIGYTQDDYHTDMDAIPDRFEKAFNFLSKQKIEYKAFLSIFGSKPSKKEYESILIKSKIFDFLDTDYYKEKGIFKQIILENLKTISFNDLIHSNEASLKLILSIPIELLNIFDTYTTHKLLGIKIGCKKGMTKKQFNLFIDKSDIFSYFESCDNNYDSKMIKNNLKENFDAESFIKSNRIELD